MISTIMLIFEKYGLDAMQIAIIVGLVYKFATNHWKHLTDDVADIKKQVKDNSDDIRGISERVSKVEGRIE